MSQTFSVEVEGLPVNQPPSARTINNVPLNLSDDDKKTKAIDLSKYFTDPEGDTLEYTAASGNDAVATVELSDSTVTITAVAEGDAEITVSAKDATNDAVSQTFSVTVSKENNPPRLKPGYRSLPPVTGLKKAHHSEDDPATHPFNVSQYFRDDDGDDLTFEAESSNESVVTVAVSPDAASDVWTLTITVVDPGTATITVTADDGSKEGQQRRRALRRRSPQ